MGFRRSLLTQPDLDPALNKIRSVLSSHQIKAAPTVGLILGTGMAPLAREIESCAKLSYQSIPGFSSSTVSGHAGELIFGVLGSTSVVAMNGRCHYYEGFSTEQICFPVEVFASLGVKSIIIGNASGGVNPKYSSGEVMLIDSHLDLMFRGNSSSQMETVSAELKRSGKRNVYSESLKEDFMQIARRHDLVLHQGVYAALSGPNYETRSEYRMLRKLGADVVGMSTIPEANTAVQLGMDVVGLSTITNVAKPDALESTTHEEVIEAVNSAEKTLLTLLIQFLSK